MHHLALDDKTMCSSAFCWQHALHAVFSLPWEHEQQRQMILEMNNGMIEAVLLHFAISKQNNIYFCDALIISEKALSLW
jgi:hypothetical protein